MAIQPASFLLRPGFHAPAFAFRLFLTIALSLPFLLFSQGNCNCNRAKEITEKSKAMRADTKLSEDQKYAYFSGLVKDKDPACVILGYGPYLNHLYYSSRRDDVPAALQALKQLLIQQDCPDSNYVVYYNLLGLVAYSQKKMDSMVHYTLRAMEASDHTKENKYRIQATYNLGVTLLNMEDYEGALFYLRQSIGYLERSRELDPINCVGQMGGIASSYLIFHDYLDSTQSGWLDTSRVLLTQAVDLARAEVPSMLTPAFVSKAHYHSYMKEYAIGLQYLDSAEKYTSISQKTDHPCDIAHFRVEFLKKLGKPGEALVYGSEALRICDSIGTQPRTRLELLRLVKNLALEAGDYRTASNYLEIMYSYLDSTLSADKVTTVRELEQKYQKKENEAKISTLEQEKEIQSLRIRSLIFAVVGAVIMALAVILILVVRQRVRLLRSRQAVLEAEQRLNRARINPHVFFNILSSLQTLSLDEKRRDEVPKYMAKYARLMRITLESTYSELTSLELELEYLEDYLALQNLRFPGLFRYSIDMEPDIDPSEVQVPPLMLQPFAENSIEHGFKQRTNQQPAELRVKVTRTGNGYVLAIEDNGTAEVESGTSHPGFPSRSSQIIEDRLFLLNRRSGRKAKFSLNRLQLPQGYRVELTVPA
jgi:tetratricopeptide (TPR) repeat protein